MTFPAFIRANAPFLAAGVLLSFTSSYGQTFFIAIFAGEIRGAFGLSNGAWGGIYTLGTTVSAVAMVWAGALTDRFRVRVLGGWVAVLLALACVAMAAVPVWWALVPVIVALRLLGQGMMSHLSVVAMARWFVATRGRALSVSSMGFALGQAVLPVLFVALMGSFGWRALWLLAAVLSLAAAPVLMRLLAAERTPQSVAQTTQSEGMDGRHWRRAEVLRHWLFWAMVPALLGPPAWGTALFFHQVHLTEVKGWPLAGYVALLPLYTATSVAATFATGAAIDRFGTARLMPLYLIPFGVAFALMWEAQSLWGAAAALAVFGIATGAQSTLPSAFWAEFYGTRHLGAIKAMAAAVMVFGSAIGPGITGWAIDLGVDFPRQMIAIAAYYAITCAVVGAAILRARRGLPAREVDVTGA